MSRIHGFPPLAQPDALILILGSMPSRESLARQQYYAHPRNAFWPIVSELLGVEAADYDERARLAVQRGVAVWDVFSDCIRPGSLDSDIDDGTAEINDFTRFFREHPGIGHIFFNGAKAESVYLKRVLPKLESRAAEIPHLRLPSTSPANAGMSLAQKKSAWRAIIEKGLECRT